MTEPNGPEWKFEFSGGRLCLDFANTVDGSRANPTDHLGGYKDLVAWSRQAGVMTAAEARDLVREARRRPEEATATLAHALALREAIYRIFAADAKGLSADPADLAILNAALSRALAHLRVGTSADGYAWAWQPEPESLDQMLWVVARSAADLLVSEGEHQRVRKCSGAGCDWLFMDMSRNHSRRWCDMKSCGNRAKARRYYARKRSHRGPTTLRP